MIRKKERILRELQSHEAKRKTAKKREYYQVNEVLEHVLPCGLAEDSLSSDSDRSSEISEEEKQIYNAIHVEDDILTSGYTTISSNQDDIVPTRKGRDAARQAMAEDNESDELEQPSKQEGKSSLKKGALQKDQSGIGKSSRSKTISFLDPSSTAA